MKKQGLLNAKKTSGNKTALLSKRYAKALGISAIGTVFSYAAIVLHLKSYCL